MINYLDIFYSPITYPQAYNDPLDTSNFWMMSAVLEADQPALAVCRGLQVLNVVSGGSLYQDIPTQFLSDVIHRGPADGKMVEHNITVETDTTLARLIGAGQIAIPSSHHQGIKTLGAGLFVMARSSDGFVEAVERADKKFIVGLQFHPEYQIDKGNFALLGLFNGVVAASNPYNGAETFLVKSNIKGYLSSYDAALEINGITTYPIGNYFVYKKASNGMINISTSSTVPGIWINPQP